MSINPLIFATVFGGGVAFAAWFAFTTYKIRSRHTAKRSNGV